MNCSQFRIKISEFLDKELHYSTLRQFSEHRQACPDCDALARGMETTQQVLRSPAPVSLSAGFMTGLMTRLEAERVRKPAWWQRLFEPSIAGFSPVSASGMLAAALAIVIIGLSIFNPETAPIVEPPSVTSQNVPSTGPIPKDDIVPMRSNTPVVAAETPEDSTTQEERENNQGRDFSKEIKYVDQKRR